MTEFSYNEIRSKFVRDVELLPDDDEEWVEFRRSLYSTTEDIPEERRDIIESDGTELYIELSSALLDGEWDRVADTISVPVTLPRYVANPEEVKSEFREKGRFGFDIEVEYKEVDVQDRADCQYSQPDEYPNPADDPYCCWECSDKPNEKPEKFDGSDEPGETCKKSTLPEWKLLKRLRKICQFDDSSMGVVLQESSLDPENIHRVLNREAERKDCLRVAWRAAFPDHDYYYQRSEAVLRDLDADISEDQSVGEGGVEFEQQVQGRLRELAEVHDKRVFKIHFEPDAPDFVWGDFVQDPTEPTFKEADAIVDFGYGPVIIEIFTRRSTLEKAKQVENYAEFYELAEGEKPETLLLTDSGQDIMRMSTLDEFLRDGGSQRSLEDFI